MELPSENKRVKEIIDFYCNGNVNQFSRQINVSQPRISRLFNIDQRSGKYPLLSFDIAQSIINKFIDVSSEWLLTGKGSMHKRYVSEDADQILNEPKHSYNKQSNDTLIQLMQDKIDLLEENKELQTQEIQRLKKELKATKSDQEITRSKGHVTS